VKDGHEDPYIPPTFVHRGENNLFLVIHLYDFMKFSTENDNNFGYEKIRILVDNMPLINVISGIRCADSLNINRLVLRNVTYNSDLFKGIISCLIFRK
jgi:hypothetical protein